MTINWLHLSDFHIGKERYPQQNICKEIIEHVKERISIHNRPLDFVFITGDLANKGLANEFKEFYNDFFNNLVETVNLDFERIVIIPGNHDVNINVGQAVERYGIFNRLQSFFDPTENGLQDRKYLFERFSEYIKSDQFSPKLDEKHWLESKSGCSIRIFDNINNHKVGIIGLNTSWLCEGDKPDKGNLTPGVEITAQALETIKSCNVKIVLGHHPFSWLINEYLSPEDSKEIKSLFGQHKVIYLHGHLHNLEENFEYSTGSQFLSIGAGACFAARKDEIWKNGLLWGSLDVKEEEVFIEPLNFNRKEREKWIFDSQAFSNDFINLEKRGFVFPIPKPFIKPQKTTKSINPPAGWRIIDKHFLNSKRGGFRPSELPDFFDGAFPTWSSMLSNEIPLRPITKKLITDFNQAKKNNELCLRLLLGAGGEGKTTVLMQTITGLISSEENWNILWQESVNTDVEELNWPELYFENLPEGPENWLIVSDSADTIVKGLWNTLEILNTDGRGDIHFLVSCRTSDWMTANANLLSWELRTNNYEKITLSLKKEEAEVMLRAWKQHGGLRELEKFTMEEAISRFQQAALSEGGRVNEKESDEGTLLGAMLSLRYGRRLRSHVLDLLKKLHEKMISSDTSLLDAYAFIAIPHAEDVRILSKTVLAKAVECKRSDLYSKILSKLADEAAILTPAFAGRYQENILTRHQSIAETVKDILINDFKYDITETVYVPLIQSAIRLFHEETNKVPYLSEWNLLPDRFFKQEKIELAIRLIDAKQEIEPDNPFHITELANLFRTKGLILEAAQQFRESPERIHRDRTFFTEWGVCENTLKNLELSIWLISISISDTIERKIVGYKIRNINETDIGYAFYNLSKAFKSLYMQNEADKRILSACFSCAALALKTSSLEDDTKDYLNNNISYCTSKGTKILDEDNSNLINIIEQQIRHCAQNVEKDTIPKWLKPADELTFKYVERYFGVTPNPQR